MSDIISRQVDEDNGIFVTDEPNGSFIYETGDGTVIHVQIGSKRYDRKTTIKICSENNNINTAIHFESNEDFNKFRELINNLK